MQAAPAAGGGRQIQQQRIGKSIQGIVCTHLQISNRDELLETMKNLLQKIFIIHLSWIGIQDKSKVSKNIASGTVFGPIKG